MWQLGWEGSLGKNGYTYIMTELLCSEPETITLVISYTPILNKKLKKKCLKKNTQPSNAGGTDSVSRWGSKISQVTWYSPKKEFLCPQTPIQFSSPVSQSCKDLEEGINHSSFWPHLCMTVITQSYSYYIYYIVKAVYCHPTYLTYMQSTS